MAFDSFSIRRLVDNTIINLNEVDKMVCEEFNLELSDEDYGHFFITLTEEEQKRGGHLGHSQKTISWAGLVNLIVEDSFINYGKCSVYDMEAAVAWVREHAVRLPLSISEIISNLMHFLNQKGLYIFVNYHRDEERNQDGYVCACNGYSIYKNQSGVFECDNRGNLLNFYPDAENLLEESVVREVYQYNKDFYRPCVHELIIPEGVVSIDGPFFNDGYVKDEIRFPESLRSIGGSDYPVFAHSHFPWVVIPSGVNMIGFLAFCHSEMESVSFERLFDCKYLRQFRDAQIGTLYLPRENRQEWEQRHGKYAYLYQFQDQVEFY
jgi:hypothetical protein